jgi:hypothetical protein
MQNLSRRGRRLRISEARKDSSGKGRSIVYQKRAAMTKQEMSCQNARITTIKPLHPAMSAKGGEH